jgi:hypothetical protein
LFFSLLGYSGTWWSDSIPLRTTEASSKFEAFASAQHVTGRNTTGLRGRVKECDCAGPMWAKTPSWSPMDT